MIKLELATNRLSWGTTSACAGCRAEFLERRIQLARGGQLSMKMGCIPSVRNTSSYSLRPTLWIGFGRIHKAAPTRCAVGSTWRSTSRRLALSSVVIVRKSQ